ncbi:MAG TPA: NADH-ubiquinone oxidoreductase-F iron-sulfur binding region domain-containing protein [Ilumatobacter sp.]|nr:NADH-ubiquinone oxidoreductase-F iron-sulfur binding region domain-containing protein [Ilumatobacter sp.]
MDVKTRAAPPTDAERAAVGSVLGAERPRPLHVLSGGHRNKARRHLLLPTLHAVNDRVGWISSTAIDHIAERLDVSPAEIYGVASFYALFALTPRDPHQVHVCTDLACRANGGPAASDLPPGAHASPCLGLCERAPAALVIDAGAPVDRAVAGHVTRMQIAGWAAGGSPGPEAAPAAAVRQAGDESLVLLRRAGRADPFDIDAYIADGGFEALAKARQLGPEGVIAAVTASGLVGRGGAAFPTGRKWEAVRTQPALPHYLVCNADESEPGTFKDRVLIEIDPFNVVESMCIAALATGSEHGFVYIRGEYPRAQATLEHAVAESRRRGYLGVDFDITIVRGAGAYICGEETAIFNSIEGHRGEPRNKPPFPFEVGLFGKPTAVNNVETLANVPGIVLHGHVANRRLFCLSGAVARPGVYEVELGITLRQLIELAGGMRAGSELQSVLLGGAAGGFAGPGDLDLVLDHESTRDAGLTLGSGVVMVHDQHVDMVDQLRQIAAFFADESCGQCVPCRVGTVRQEEAIERLAHSASAGDLSLLREIGQAMRDASICGLGQTAANAIDSAVVRLGVFTR